MAPGLSIVALGKSFDAFKAQLGRVAEEEEQIDNAFFAFTRRLAGYRAAISDGRRCWRKT